jgi:DNA-binding winged helix-turn-helix (wHTH) protein
LSRKLEDESGDLRLHLDGLVGQVAALRREIKDIQSNVEGELGCLRDDSHHKALENKTLQDLVTEGYRFTAKVTDMSVCSKNHHEGLSNHAQALRELQSEHKGTRATTDKFNEVMHYLSKQCIFTATQLNRIELQETENEAKVDAGFQKVFSEIEYLKSLITGPSNCTRSAHITLKRKSPDPDSMSTEDPEGGRLPKLRSIDPKSTPQSNSSLEPSYQSTSYEQETSPSSQCEFNDKSLLDSRDVSSEIDDKNEPNSLAPSFNFANPSFFFQADVSAATPSNANANASNTFGSGESACGFTFGSTSATFGSSIRSPSPLGGSALLSTNEKSGTSAVFGSSSAFSGGFDSLALSNSVQSFGSDQATEAKTEEPSSQAQATATTPFGSGAAIPSFGSQKANPFGSFATSSGKSSSGDGEKASVGAQEESEITVTQRGYNIDDDMSIMDLYLLGKKKKEDSESNQKASSLQHDEVQKKEDSKQAVVSSLQSNDVLLGRGGNTWKHHGNEQLRKMALERAAQYASLTKKEKSNIMR